jgi:hypothetical protein
MCSGVAALPPRLRRLLNDKLYYCDDDMLRQAQPWLVLLVFGDFLIISLIIVTMLMLGQARPWRVRRRCSSFFSSSVAFALWLAVCPRPGPGSSLSRPTGTKITYNSGIVPRKRR